MKKLVILSMLLLLMTVSVFAGTSRSYIQKVVAADPAVDILTLVTSTLSTYTAPNYTVRAWIVARPGEVLQTGVAPTTTLRLNKTGNGTTVPYYACTNLQLGSFATQWVAGDVMHIEVSKTNESPVQVLSWEYTIPTGTTVINVSSPTQNIPPLAPVVTTYDATITSNLTGKAIFDGGVDTGHVTPWTFSWDAGSTHVITVAADPLYTTPAPQTITEAGTYTFTYVLIPPVPDNTIVVAGPGAFSYPSTDAHNTLGVSFSGTVMGAGTLVFGEITPGAKVGPYEGYLNVQKVYTVSATDQAILNGATLNFNYGTTPGYQYVAIHWGGVNNGFYPVDHPANAGVPTPGYYFNGGVGWAAPYNFPLGSAPFTGAGYAGGILTIGPIPTYLAKEPGVFEIILGKDVDLPVVLSAFNAVATAQMFVNLQWTTESETNSLGFNVLRSTDNVIEHAQTVNYSIIPGTGTTTTHNYNFVDDSVEPSTMYYYWLEMVNNDGTSSFSSYVTVTTNGQTPPAPEANATVLRNAFPNPVSVSGTTTFSYDVKRGETATLTIYNVLGQTVRSYQLQSGLNQSFKWNGKDSNGAVCGSGIYFYKLSSVSANSTKKMVIVK